MNIPNKIRVGSFDYNVKMIDTPLVLNNVEVNGIIEYENCEIKIKTDISKQYQQKVFLHEMVHAILFERKIDLGDEEEHIVDSIAMSLQQIIRDNPDIFTSKDTRKIY